MLRGAKIKKNANQEARKVRYMCTYYPLGRSQFAIMYLDISLLHKNGRTYKSVLLRESYREQGKVKKRTIANLSACSEQEVAAIKLALRHKSDLSEVASATEYLTLRQGASVGAVWLVYKIASRLGISVALGNSRQGKLALWQVIARVIDQGSRLSAVRFATNHGACDVLDLETFHEEHLYANLDWLHENQEEIETKLARKLHGKNPIELFLYDVTSSYLEGEKNALAAFGYNRDKNATSNRLSLACYAILPVRRFRSKYFQAIHRIQKRLGSK